ncbi:MAG: SUMF1/EgtB/PvdO family nonheme iron enzyme [Saprospiraceae bacterium]|nr:SUMF1/EgtB/PvdO family nonheme iron enzyme [Saprospiraceae bacterium]
MRRSRKFFFEKCRFLGRELPERAVLRGGSWNNNDNNCRAANRNRNNRNNRNNNNGFRCARTSPKGGKRTVCTGCVYGPSRPR